MSMEVSTNTQLPMKMEKIVSLMVWIPLQALALFLMFYILDVCSLIDSCGAIDTNFDAAISFFLGTVILLVVGVLLVTIVGGIIIVRHKYGSKRFWKHIAVWYAVYLALSTGLIIDDIVCWDIRFLYDYFPFYIVCSLYPVLVLLVLMAVVAIARRIRRLVKRNSTTR